MTPRHDEIDLLSLAMRAGQAVVLRPYIDATGREVAGVELVDYPGRYATVCGVSFSPAAVDSLAILAAACRAHGLTIDELERRALDAVERHHELLEAFALPECLTCAVDARCILHAPLLPDAVDP